jgi:hypothetical protein
MYEGRGLYLLMAGSFHYQSDILLPSELDASYDIIGPGDINGVDGIVPELTGFRCWRKGVT